MYNSKCGTWTHLSGKTLVSSSFLQDVMSFPEFIFMFSEKCVTIITCILCANMEKWAYPLFWRSSPQKHGRHFDSQTASSEGEEKVCWHQPEFSGLSLTQTTVCWWWWWWWRPPAGPCVSEKQSLSRGAKIKVTSDVKHYITNWQSHIWVT